MILAIDTSGAQTSVAIVENKLPLQKAIHDFPISQRSSSHSGSLTSLVKTALSNCNLSIKNISALVIGAGPGSFTGLRIGFAFAKGMSIAERIPVYSISSLSAAAWEFREKGSVILAIDDARRGEFFATSYLYQSKRWISQMPDQIVSMTSISEWLEANPKGILASANHELSKIWPQICLSSNLAVSLAEQAIETNLVRHHSFEEFGGISHLAEIAPVYIRKVAALTIQERNAGLS